MSKKLIKTSIRDLTVRLLVAENLGNLSKIRTSEWALRQKLLECYDHYLPAKRHSLRRLQGLITYLNLR